MEFVDHVDYLDSHYNLVKLKEDFLETVSVDTALLAQRKLLKAETDVNKF